MLERNDTIVVLIDFQEKLMRAMSDKEDLIKSAEKLVKGSVILDLPILWTEQNPKGLGKTIPEVSQHLGAYGPPYEKMAFSACGESDFVSKLKEMNKKQALIAGIESHVCVYQTAADLIGMGYEVQVVADCTSSRKLADRALGWERVKGLGGTLTSVEMALFELLKRAEGEEFKKMLPVIK